MKDDPIGIRTFNGGDHLEGTPERRSEGRVQDALEGVLDIAGVKKTTIMESYSFPKGEAIRRGVPLLPLLNQVLNRLSGPVLSEEPSEYQIIDP